MKSFVPRRHRIMRIQREIRAHESLVGVRIGNLRELVLRRVEQKGFACNCIRCREVALADAGEMDEEDELVLRREDYAASGGEEVFCSYEYGTSGRVGALVTMRHPSAAAHSAETESCCSVSGV